MGESTLQRMILRKDGSEGFSAQETVERLGKAGAVILDQNPGSLLIEGEAGVIKSAAEAMSGWKAVPVKHYAVPDTKVRLQK